MDPPELASEPTPCYARRGGIETPIVRKSHRSFLFWKVGELHYINISYARVQRARVAHVHINCHKFEYPKCMTISVPNCHTFELSYVRLYNGGFRLMIKS